MAYAYVWASGLVEFCHRKADIPEGAIQLVKGKRSATALRDAIQVKLRHSRDASASLIIGSIRDIEIGLRQGDPIDALWEFQRWAFGAAGPDARV